MIFFNPSGLVRIYIIIFTATMAGISYKVYEQVMFLRSQRKQLIQNYYDPNIDNVTYTDTLDAKYTERRNNVRRIIKIKADIKRINLRQKVYNTHYLSSVKNSTTIIVIQVHSNVFLLRQLLSSLKTAYAIDNALIIFSHDYFDSEINKAVHSVTFAKYMQIFYPFSIQLHPNVFPGSNHNCHNGVCDKAIVRDAVAAQQKHHWWWQMNQIFDHLEVIQNHTNTILFLEEDNYVTQDFLMVHKLLENVRSMHCPVCEMISLGAHEPDVTQYNKTKALVNLEVWSPTMPKIGIAFDRTVWRSIKTWSKEFCYFDDYTWDNSLKYIGSKHMNSSFYFAAIDAPRVFRVEKCDDKDISCKLEYKVDEVKRFVEMVKKAMFPWVLMLKVMANEPYSVKPLGYFNDARDHELCLHFTKSCVWF